MSALPGLLAFLSAVESLEINIESVGDGIHSLHDVGLRLLLASQKTSLDHAQGLCSRFRPAIGDGDVALQHAVGAKHTNQVRVGDPPANRPRAFRRNNQPTAARVEHAITQLRII